MSRIRGPYVRFCERDEAVTPHPTRLLEFVLFSHLTQVLVRS
ncbi:hypothetical protein DFP81_12413 [Marinomonas pollencensis]|uniref:Uncharacterized protein n=1 Tax=Marinomonas pollencensis TaxID=491954 RepID=A0A3E0D6M6_9GAMM|nr:hypothetical protein DFP81_12413 [Marinomonas pollencensis]